MCCSSAKATVPRGVPLLRARALLTLLTLRTLLGALRCHFATAYVASPQQSVAQRSLGQPRAQRSVARTAQGSVALTLQPAANAASCSVAWCAHPVGSPALERAAPALERNAALVLFHGKRPHLRGSLHRGSALALWFSARTVCAAVLCRCAVYHGNGAALF